MVKFVRIFKNNEFILIPLDEYFNEYNCTIPEGWDEVCLWINKIFNIQTAIEFSILKEEFQVENFNVSAIKKFYIKLKKEYSFFDDDILRFISFLLSTKYFSKIGNPTISKWLNVIDINHPFTNNEELNYGFSFMDALQYKFGQNAIRKKLLSTFKWIGSQSGT